MAINLDNSSYNLNIIFIKIINNNRVVRKSFLYFIKIVNGQSIKTIKIINNNYSRPIRIIKKTLVSRY